MFKSLQDKLARQAVASLSPEDALRLVETYLPDLVAQWSKEERLQLIQQLLTQHLPVILDDLSQEEKAAWVRQLLPGLLKVFPLDDVDLLSLLG